MPQAAERNNKPTSLVIHHTVTSASTGNDSTETLVNNGHRGRKFPLSANGWYVGYHFMVFPDGEVRQYRASNEEGAHCKKDGMNFKSIGISLVGNFSNGKPTVEQAKAALSLIQDQLKSHSIPAANIAPHRKYKPTQCWGNKLSDNVLQELQAIAGTPELTDEEWFEKHLPELNPKHYPSALKKLARFLAKKVLEWFRADNY